MFVKVWEALRCLVGSNATENGSSRPSFVLMLACRRNVTLNFEIIFVNFVSLVCEIYWTIYAVYLLLC